MVLLSSEYFRQIILEQREEIPLIYSEELVEREKADEVDLHSNLAQIITGIRRCGKSTLAHMVLRNKKYAYVNFDDERLAELSADNLNNILEALYAVYGEFTHILFDEIQNVEKWYLFINRLLRKKIGIILTGSNSRLLNQEMASHLTGRYVSIELFPLSFHEYLQLKNKRVKPPETAQTRGLAIKFFMDYIHEGGFPEVAKSENKDTYVPALFDAIVTRDIIYRHSIRHVRTFREIALWLSGNFAKEISYNRIKNIFGLGSDNTAKNYVSYMEEAWLFISLSKFSYKNQESIRNRKLYLTDTSFASLGGANTSPNDGRLLENAVLLHLHRHKKQQGYELFYYKADVEVDFLIYHRHKVIELIQVCLSLEDKKTRNREIRALLTAAKDLRAKKMTIITLSQRETIEMNGMYIQVKPIIDLTLNYKI